MSGLARNCEMFQERTKPKKNEIFDLLIIIYVFNGILLCDRPQHYGCNTSLSISTFQYIAPFITHNIYNCDASPISDLM